MKIPQYKRLISYLFPVTLEKTIGENMTLLLLQIYRNQYMLGTPRAIYSFGTSYDPFRKPFSLLKDELKTTESFLLLGTGLGSALKILQDKYHLFPESILVDNDKDVIHFSLKYMDLNARQNVQWRCMEALDFLSSNTKKFDLIGIDLFKDLVQPAFVTSPDFLDSCSKALQSGGICLFNMILEDDNQIAEVEKQMKVHFNKVRFIMDKVNTYFICSC